MTNRTLPIPDVAKDLRRAFEESVEESRKPNSWSLGPQFAIRSSTELSRDRGRWERIFNECRLNYSIGRPDNRDVLNYDLQKDNEFRLFLQHFLPEVKRLQAELYSDLRIKEELWRYNACMQELVCT